MAVKSPAVAVYVDPYFGPSPSREWQRRFPPLIDPNRINVVDAVLVTHEHEDHCDKATIAAVSSHGQAAVYAPPSAIACVRDRFKIRVENVRLRVVGPGTSFKVGDVDIVALGSADPQCPDAVTYVLKTPGGTVFHSGDSHYSELFKRVSTEYRIDVAFLNLGKNPAGEYYYLTPADFLKTASDLQARLTVPMHWDLWEKTYIDPESCMSQWSEINVKVMKEGERLELPV